LAKAHLKCLKLIKIMAVEGKYWDKRDKELAIADKESKANQILELLAEKKALEKTTKDANAKLCVLWQELQVEEQKYLEKDCALLHTIEEHFLERFGVTRVAYHGGNLTGGLVKKLMQHARLIFTELEDFLKGVTDEKQILDESDWTKLANHLKIPCIAWRALTGCSVNCVQHLLNKNQLQNYQVRWLHSLKPD